jgi:hypothetical protein
MTADGILYIDEECRDKFEKELDEAFGKDIWRLDGSQYSHIWDATKMPPEVNADVLNKKTDEIIGRCVIENKYEQEYDDISDCMFLRPYPNKIKLLEKC